MVHRHEVDHWPKTTMSPYRKCSRRGLARISLGCGTRVPMKSEQKMMFVQKPGSSLTRVASDGPSTATASYAVSAWRLCRSSETKWLGSHEMANGENISSTKTPVPRQGSGV
eukprot:scaffold15619_cov69-Phaeocystis_antarctica.AAC.1